MSVASTAARAPSAASDPGTREHRGRGTVRATVLTVGVAIGAFLLALNGGFYDPVDREALAVAVWGVVAIVVALGLWPTARAPRTALAAGALLAAFATFTVLSTTWAPAAGTAVTEGSRVLLYLGVFAVAVLATRVGDAAGATDGLALGIAAVAILALASRLFPDLTAPREVAQLLPGTENRLSYPVDYWNGLGILVGLGTPLLLHAATRIEEGRWRAIALAPLPAIAGAVYLTSSRGAAAVAAVGLVAFLALTDRRLLALWAAGVGAAGSAAAVAVLHARDVLVTGPLRSDLAYTQGRSAAALVALICLGTATVYLLGGVRAPVRPRLPTPVRAGVAVAVVLVAAVGVAASHPSNRIDRFKVPPSEDPVNEVGESHLLSGGGSGRWQFWGAAIDELERHPLRGGGAGSYESWWAANGSITYFVRDAHSLWLETLGELGILGLALLAAFFGVILFAAALVLRRAPPGTRSAPAALAAVVLAFCVGAALDWMWELTVVATIAMLAAGLLAGPAARPVARAAARRPLALPARIALPVGGLLLAAALTLPLLGDLRMEDSADAAERGATAEAVDAALDARKLTPWSARPLTQLALLAEQAGDLAAARTWIARALEKDGANWRLWLTAARIQTKRGEAREAGRSLARARGRNPRSPLFQRPLSAGWPRALAPGSR